jgi:hypothetical protein
VRTKRVAINLDRALHDRLAQQAKSEERTPAQQAAWILRRQLLAEQASHARETAASAAR